MALGFGAGVYIHCHLVRHWLHLLAIGILRGFIWLLQRTDHYYKEPKTKEPKFIKAKPDKTTPPIIRAGRPTGIEVGLDELAEYLNNPEVSVAKR